MPISELKLAKELIRKPSITPKDAGAINLLAKNLRSLGFNCKIINFKNELTYFNKLLTFNFHKHKQIEDVLKFINSLDYVI